MGLFDRLADAHLYRKIERGRKQAEERTGQEEQQKLVELQEAMAAVERLNPEWRFVSEEYGSAIRCSKRIDGGVYRVAISLSNDEGTSHVSLRIIKHVDGQKDVTIFDRFYSNSMEMTHEGPEGNVRFKLPTGTPAYEYLSSYLHNTQGWKDQARIAKEKDAADAKMTKKARDEFFKP